MRPDTERRSGRSAYRLVAAGLLALFALQAEIALRRDSVTIDEFVHLPIGLHALYTGDVRQDPINTHLPRMIAALPLLLSPPAFAPPAAAQSWGLGYHFMEANAADYQPTFERARRMIVLLSLVAAALTARWALELYGPLASLVALGFFVFTPSLLAHGHLVTLDMAGTLGFLLALFACWRFLGRPSLGGAALVGLAVGLANLLKLSAFALVADIAALWLIRALVERGDGPRLADWIRYAAVASVVALFTLNAGYGFDGTFSRLTDAALAGGGKLDRLAESVPWLRLPLPRAFVDGLDMAMEVGQVREPTYFLAGELSATGWWYYHLAAFAMKCPLPLLLASLFAVGAWLAGRSPGRRDYALFVPVAVLFAANSGFNSLAIGERHVLAAYPLLAVAASPWIAGALAAARRPKAGRFPVAAVAASGLLAWNVASTVAVAPRYLQYFNEAAGGAERGHLMLVDSNVDWGQDLLRLRDYMDRSGIDHVALAYFGRVDPSVYGIRYVPLEPGRTRGKAVVSATFLMGRPYFWILGGRWRWVPSGTYAYLQERAPVARVGSMFVFDLP